jgi:hypothetical protein
MFTVRWVSHSSTGKPVVSEESAFTSLDSTVLSAQERLYNVRLRFIQSPPDGFVVFDDVGKELRHGPAQNTRAMSV